MKKSIIVLLILAILAGIGLTSCKNEVQAPVDELVSISFGYDSSRALTASLQPFAVGDYYWFYESEKADGSRLTSGQTGAGLTNLSNLSKTNVATKMLEVMENSRSANGNNKGLGEPIQGFSKGLWNFRLMAATVDGNNKIHPVYIGEAHGVLIDNDNHTVNVVVSPLSADYPLDVLGEKGYLEIGEIEFKEASLTDQVSLDDNLWTITDMVSRNNSGTWVEVSHEPDHNDTGDFDYFELSAGTYLYTRIYKYNGSEITSGSVIVTVYPNLTTTVSGFVTELTTSFNFSPSENPDVLDVSVSSESITYQNSASADPDKTYTLKTSSTTQSVSKVEAKVSEKAALEFIEQYTQTQIDLGATNVSLDDDIKMDLVLGVNTTATTATSVAYDISMTANISYTKSGETEPAVVTTTDVDSVSEYVVVTIDMQSGLSSVSVTHSGYAMVPTDDMTKAGDSNYASELKYKDVNVNEGTEKDPLWVGFYKYDSTNNKLYIKTKSFSPFVVNYVYATSAPMAKVIRYVYDKTNETVMKSATITSAAKETLGIKTDETRIEGILADVISSQVDSIYNTKLPYNLRQAVLTGTLVTFMPRVNAQGMTIDSPLTTDQLPESDYYYSGGMISSLFAKEKEWKPWRAEFKITSDYSFTADELCLIGSYWSYCKDYQFVSDWGAGTATPAVYVMKGSSEYVGIADYITYDLLLYLCRSDDEPVRPGFTCGAYLGSGATAATLGKTIKVQLILTNDNFQEVKDDPTKRVEVVCAEVVTGFRPATTGDDVTISYAGNDLFTASLWELAEMVNSGNSFEGCTVTLNHDVDLENVEWTPIGTPEHPFGGVFDGRNHKIRNLTINSTTGYAGLFGVVVGKQDNTPKYASDVWDDSSRQMKDGSTYSEDKFTAVVKNVVVDGFAFNSTSNDYHGTITGFAVDAYFANLTVKNGTISTAGKVGGVIGSTTGSVVFDTLKTENTVNVIATGHTAGGIIAGTNRNYVDNSEGVSFTVSEQNGAHVAVIVNCENNAAITGDTHIGGVVGQPANTTGLQTVIFNCANNGTINQKGPTEGPTGGIAGSSTGVSFCVISNCVNNGEIVGTSDYKSSYIGGIVGNGKTTKILRCTNTGNITGYATKVAGIAAELSDSGTEVDLETCFNTGVINNVYPSGQTYDVYGGDWSVQNFNASTSAASSVTDIQAKLDSAGGTQYNFTGYNSFDGVLTINKERTYVEINADSRICSGIVIQGNRPQTIVLNIPNLVCTLSGDMRNVNLIIKGENSSITITEGSRLNNVYVSNASAFTNNGTIYKLQLTDIPTATNGGTLGYLNFAVSENITTSFTNNGIITEQVRSSGQLHQIVCQGKGTVDFLNNGTINYDYENAPYNCTSYIFLSKIGDSVTLNINCTANSVIDGYQDMNWFCMYNSGNTYTVRYLNGAQFTVNGAIPSSNNYNRLVQNFQRVENL